MREEEAVGQRKRKIREGKGEEGEMLEGEREGRGGRGGRRGREGKGRGGGV